MAANSTRIVELDLTKSFIILISMIGIHSWYDLTTLDASDYLSGYLLNILSSQAGAPMFMFCMGAALLFSRHQSASFYLKRGVHLLTTGMVLNVLRYLPTAFRAFREGETDIFGGWTMIFNVDILQFAGMAFMLLALLKKLRLNSWGILAVGVGLNVLGTLLDGLTTGSFVADQVLGYFFPTRTCCCFPLFNWFIFVASGNVMGWIYRNGRQDRFFRVAFPLGTIVTAAYLYLCLVAKAPFTRALQDDWGLYSMHTPDALLTVCGIAPFMTGGFRLLARVLPKGILDSLAFPSRHINQYYCVSWVWIMWTANLFLFVPKAQSEGAFLLLWLAMIVLTTLTVVVYVKYLKPAFNNFFGRNAAAWTAGVWVVLLAFGAWFYITVSSASYVLPY